jgi:hypothetical protein
MYSLNYARVGLYESGLPEVWAVCMGRDHEVRTASSEVLRWTRGLDARERRALCGIAKFASVTPSSLRAVSER